MAKLVPIKVTLSEAHFGDAMAYLHSIGGLLEGLDCTSGRTAWIVSASIPESSVSLVARWLIDNLPDRGASAAFELRTDNV
jgi:hypothetical protein